MFSIERYYEKGKKLIEQNKVEQGITAFIFGLERGCSKCAYGILHTVTHFCSYTLSEEEGASIFRDAYPQIKRLAELGDAEAMTMVAEGIRLGFVEDEAEPYFCWLMRAAELGEAHAIDLLRELEETDDPLGLPDISEFLVNEGVDATDALLLEQEVEDIDLSEEHVLFDEPDHVMREQFGIADHLKRKELKYELMKCRDDVEIEKLAGFKPDGFTERED